MLPPCLPVRVSPFFNPQVKDVSGFEAGQQLNVDDMFKAGDLVDVAGTTIGKGFQGESCRVFGGLAGQQLEKGGRVLGRGKSLVGKQAAVQCRGLCNCAAHSAHALGPASARFLSLLSQAASRSGALHAVT
jgi:hypothetical protein